MKQFFDKGYIHIYLPEHPNAKTNGCMPLHRYLMSKKIGRALLPNEQVHHKDENILNNNINNLELLTIEEHTHKHKGYRLKHPCIICQKITTNEKFCSIKCNSINQQTCMRPSREELERLLKEYSYIKVGKMFNVSDNTIRKWLRAYRVMD